MSELIRLATKELHEDLELHAFNQKMFRGEQTTEERRIYLSSQYSIFEFLDPHVHPDMRRCDYIKKDLAVLGGLERKLPFGTNVYTSYLEILCENIPAHIYLNYMGLMFGGQIMKKRYPKTSSIYEFNNLTELKNSIRKDICQDTDDFILEVKTGFKFHIGIAKELGEHFELEERFIQRDDSGIFHEDVSQHVQNVH